MRLKLPHNEYSHYQASEWQVTKNIVSIDVCMKNFGTVGVKLREDSQRLFRLFLLTEKSHKF